MSCSINLNSNPSDPEYFNDPSDMLKKITKYLIEGVVVGIVAKWISSHKLSIQEISIISLTAAGTLILLDVYSPAVSASYRHGLGLALGAKTILNVADKSN